MGVKGDGKGKRRRSSFTVLDSQRVKSLAEPMDTSHKLFQVVCHEPRIVSHRWQPARRRKGIVPQDQFENSSKTVD